MAKRSRSGRAAPGHSSGMKIRKGDLVTVLAGRDRGREGRVIAAYPDQGRVLVDGVNIIRRNTKVNYQGSRGAKEGGIVTQPAPIDVSNVALVDPVTKRPARVGYRIDENGNKIRITRPGGKEIS